MIASVKPLTSIGIIGGGALGGAIGKRLHQTGLRVKYWDVNADLRTASSLDELVSSHPVILICTPSQTNRLIARDVCQVNKQGSGPAVISLAKGVEAGFITMDAVLASELVNRFEYGIISGPMLATEISAGLSAGSTIATTSQVLTAQLSDLFSQAGFITDTTDDLAGVARCGVLKNIYALGLGLADGLKLGYNFKSAFSVKAIEEYAKLLKYLGSDPNLAYSMAGLGDLLTTGWSAKSYNWRTGEQWIKTGVAKGEGINALKQLSQSVSLSDYPVAHALESIFFHEGDPMILMNLLSASSSK
jgi:glycerol-3-phosphate dehydrogenase (NAD(P)+)